MISSRQNVSLAAGRDINRLRRKNPGPPHPIDAINRELAERGWSVRDLCARIPGDPLVTRALIAHWLAHPTRELELGAIWAAKLDDALGLGNDFFLSIERAWSSHQRVLRDARRAA